MTYVEIPGCHCEGKTRRLAFYLAAEEYLCRDSEPLFFIWNVTPTVIIGRNQILEKEVNTVYCKEHDIDIIRRKSGGGAVFADMNNLMCSYICPQTSVDKAFSTYLDRMQQALKQMGLDVEKSDRNDLLLDKHKISGNAYYSHAGHSIIHGTMLFDTDIETMTRALTPAKEKLQGKGVASIRSRVINLKDFYTHGGLEEFKTELRSTLCSKSIQLTGKDIEEIEKIETGYYSNQHFLRKNPPFTDIRTKYIPGVGNIEAAIDVKQGKIDSVTFSGDYFYNSIEDVKMLQDCLKGVDFCAKEIEKRLNSIQVQDIISNLQPKELVDLISTY